MGDPFLVDVGAPCCSSLASLVWWRRLGQKQYSSKLPRSSSGGSVTNAHPSNIPRRDANISLVEKLFLCQLLVVDVPGGVVATKWGRDQENNNQYFHQSILMGTRIYYIIPKIPFGYWGLSAFGVHIISTYLKSNLCYLFELEETRNISTLARSFVGCRIPPIPVSGAIPIHMCSR